MTTNDVFVCVCVRRQMYSLEVFLLEKKLNIASRAQFLYQLVNLFSHFLAFTLHHVFTTAYDNTNIYITRCIFDFQTAMYTICRSVFYITLY